MFAVTKLRQYLLGNKFTLRTDHKPLTTIFGENKGLPVMASARVQRWALILSGFNYSVEYVKGVSNHADSLSRMPQCAVKDDCIEKTYINLIETQNCLLLNFKDIARETRRDSILSKVSQAVVCGALKELNEEAFKPYKNKDTELSVEYDCVMWGYRTVVPRKLQKLVLNELHTSHLGVVKTKALARSYVWWPGLDNDIEDLVKNCTSCQKLQSSPEKSVLIPWNPTDAVWSRIHIDFAGPIKNFYLLIVIDSYSKWVEVFKTKQITSEFTISKLDEMFSRYGFVNTIVSDNGTQFTSAIFKNFLIKNNVKQILTAPGHPATNGQAENFVKVVKKSLYANLNQNPDCNFDTILNRFLADYRNTKHCTTGETPSKIFFGRSLKTRFSSLKPPLLREKIIESQDKSIRNYSGRREVEFSNGQPVWVRDYRNPNKPSWTQAKIKQQLGPRSYCCVLTHNNKEIKRHLNQIRDGKSGNNMNGVTGDVQDAGDTQNLENDNFCSSAGSVENDEQSNSQQVEVESDVTSEGRQLRPRRFGKVVKTDAICEKDK